MPVLEIENISKSYGSIKALQGVSLQVPKGSVFGILGPNGSGKTTLLSIILNVLNQDGGNFFWFGQASNNDQRKNIGSLLETPNFYHYLSAINNLKITQSISGRGNREDIEKVLYAVNLHDRRNSRFSTYSLGMKQRLAIAAALLGDPGVLVLDEPTNGLDPVGIAEVRRLIRELQERGHTIIMASHLLNEVEKVCTHVAILKTGKIVSTGPVDEVLSDEDIIEIASSDNNSLKAVLEEFKDIVNIKREGPYLQLYCMRGKINPADLNQFCFERGIVLHHLSLQKKKLETRFFELTGN